jgi:hypothetical protein
MKRLTKLGSWSILMIFTFDVQSYKALYVKWTLFILTTVEAERIMRLGIGIGTSSLINHH